MSEALANRIMDELIASEVLSVCLTGGEPLTNYRVVKLLLKRCKEVSIKVSMNSNVTLLTNERLFELKELGLTRIFTSLLGSCPEIHDTITGVVGSHKLTIAGIERCLKLFVGISANMVVSRLNFTDIQQTAQLFASIGCEGMHIDFASRPINCSNFSALDLTREEKVKVLGMLEVINRQYGLKTWNTARVPLCLIPEIATSPEYFSSGCSAGIGVAVIGANGVIRACAMEQANSTKSLSDFSLVDLWENFNDRRTDACVPTECRDCKLLYKCGGGCHYAGYIATGKKDGCDPLMRKENAERAFEMIVARQKNVRRSISGCTTVTFGDFSVRDEEFGAVVWQDNSNSRQLVNIEARTFLRNIVPGKTYLFGTNISEDYKEFLTDLVIGGFATVSNTN
jgi:radical SAM protein with 4Fe4S-binding SPASM domain